VARSAKTPALPTVTEIALRVQEKEGAPPEILELIRRADTGDNSALDRLREVYAEMPSIVQWISDLQYAAEQEVLSTLGPGAVATFTEQARRMRAKLAGDNSSPLERLLVNRIVLDWLHALKCEIQYQRRLNGTLSLEQAAFYDKQAERAQRRFLRAMTTLAHVRKLLSPTVQVNIAEQQVNVAGTVNAGASNIE
jgi:hypothetical protein